MRALVTGASGFAGGQLVAQLAERGDEVVALVRRAAAGATAPEHVVADLLDREATVAAIARARPDVVFHLAAPQTSVGRSWDDAAATIGGNLTTAVNVLDAAARLDAAPRTVVVSSSEVFGTPAGRALPLREDAPLSPESPYGESKALVESVARFYAERLSADVVIARPFNHTGPGQPPPFVVPSLAAQVAAAERAGGGEVRVGNLSARRDFSDVRDVAAAYIRIAEAAETGSVVHVASGEAHSVQELLDTLVAAAEVDVEVVPDPELWRPSDAPLVVGDASRLRALGWRPRFSIEQTLADVLAEARAGVAAAGT